MQRTVETEVIVDSGNRDLDSTDSNCFCLPILQQARFHWTATRAYVVEDGTWENCDLDQLLPYHNHIHPITVIESQVGDDTKRFAKVVSSVRSQLWRSHAGMMSITLSGNSSITEQGKATSRLESCPFFFFYPCRIKFRASEQQQTFRHYQAKNLIRPTSIESLGVSVTGIQFAALQRLLKFQRRHACQVIQTCSLKRALLCWHNSWYCKLALFPTLLAFAHSYRRACLGCITVMSAKDVL
jgi:hypothetical protein